MQRRIASFCLIAGVAAGASAAEGVLPVRAGDRVTGQVRACGDRHLLAVDLVRGDRFRARVRVARELTEDLTVRVYDATGLLVNQQARVRVVAGETLVGPFRVASTGTHLVQVTTFTRHEIPYEVTTDVRRAPRRSAALRAGTPRTLRVAAGSLLQVRGLRADSPVTVTAPGEPPLELLPGTPRHAALVGDGLAAPASGDYVVELPEGAGRARVRVVAPSRRTGTTVAFPELPDERTSVSTWYPDTGWLADPRLAAAGDHEPPVALPPADGATGAGDALADAPAAPTADAGRALYANTSGALGHTGGVGMPIAPRPTLDETLVRGTAEPAAEGVVYTYELDDPALGRLRYRVRFAVAGRGAGAPLSLDGPVALHWTVTGDAALHAGTWTLTHDPARGVDVLEGAETVVDRTNTTLRTSAAGYAVPRDGSAPRGVLTWSVDAPQGGALTRTESFDGRGGAQVDLR